MIPADIRTLVVIQPPSPSFVVLEPDKEHNPDGKVVPIWIGHTEALYLGMALERRRFERPMTHDLLLDIMTNLDGSVERVNITKVEKATFFAQVVLKQYDRLITIDARPSDALALAVRQAAPIFMDEDVVNHVGCTFKLQTHQEGEDKAKEMEEFHEFLSNLTPEDFS